MKFLDLGVAFKGCVKRQQMFALTHVNVAADDPELNEKALDLRVTIEKLPD